MLFIQKVLVSFIGGCDEGLEVMLFGLVETG